MKETSPVELEAVRRPLCPLSTVKNNCPETHEISFCKNSILFDEFGPHSVKVLGVGVRVGGVASQEQNTLPFLPDSQGVVTCVPQEPSAIMTSHSL